MNPEARKLWASLPGQRLMQLLLRGAIDAEQRARFAPLIAQLKSVPRVIHSNKAATAESLPARIQDQIDGEESQHHD